MGVLEDILVKAKVAVDAIGEKAGNLVDVSKLNIKMAELKADLRKEYENLGKITYECHKNSITDESGISPSISQIDNLHIQIENLKTAIASIKNKVECKACGNQNEISSAFCAKCGESLSGKGSAIPEPQEDDFSEFDD